MRWAICTVLLSAACGGSSSTPAPASPTAPAAPSAPEPPPPSGPPVWDLDTKGLPALIVEDYIDLGAVVRISRFRSGQGHSYADEVESCRSMKHYFVPAPGRDWSAVAIRAPLAGEIVEMRPEWAGVQIAIRSREYPAFVVILFHVTPVVGLEVGGRVEPGEQLGTHVGTQTWSDVAIRVDTPQGNRLVSYFDAMAAPLFDRYRARGVTAKEAAVISRAERDADPLACSGETFTWRGTLPHWVDLR